MLTEDDLEDEDCLEESKADIVAFAGQYGTVHRLDVNLEAATVRIEYNGPAETVRAAATKFDGVVFGGQAVKAAVEHDGDAMDIDATTASPLSPETATAVVSSGTAPETATTSLPAAVTPTQPPSADKVMYSGDKIIPERFAECKRVPKIPNKGTPRRYATLLPETETTVKPLLREMLAELMRLQKRAIDDKNAKARRRLVMGLREVARGIRAHKVKLVVMANNLDEYGAIDDKLQEILDLAQQEAVPIFFEFHKRALGKAIGKSIKIAVIGVQNADGAHQQFKKLQSLASRHGLV